MVSNSFRLPERFYFMILYRSCRSVLVGWEAHPTVYLLCFTTQSIG
ncbi:MAG: hypothetical protein J6T41_06040 [Neisseriaceae bacterium]|nr:hypothetical protein [Neisseriaceae bacterium]